MRILRPEEYRGPTLPHPSDHAVAAAPGGLARLAHRPLVRRHPAELPQGRKAARVGRLWRVCGGSLSCDGVTLPRSLGWLGVTSPRSLGWLGGHTPAVARVARG